MEYVFVLICFLLFFYLVVYLFRSLNDFYKMEILNKEYKIYIELLKEYSFYLEQGKIIFSMRWCNETKRVKDEIEKQRQRLKELGMEVENIFD